MFDATWNIRPASPLKNEVVDWPSVEDVTVLGASPSRTRPSRKSSALKKPSFEAKTGEPPSKNCPPERTVRSYRIGRPAMKPLNGKMTGFRTPSTSATCSAISRNSANVSGYASRERPASSKTSFWVQVSQPELNHGVM